MKNALMLSALICALGLAACSQGEQQAETETPESEASTETVSTAAQIRLYAFDCGRIDMLDLAIFSRNGEYEGRQNKAADTCYLVRHPNGDLMWDAGLPDAIHEQEGGVTNGPFHIEVPTTLASQLAAAGVSPADIDYFSISHSHFDHVGNAGLFAGSTFLIDGDERAYMFRDEARNDPQQFSLVAPLEEAKTQEIDGDYDVFGDGSVVILDMPGHTPGHKSLLVHLANTGPVMLTGDLYHLIESREKRIMPVFNTSEEDTFASMDRFEAIAAEKGARVIIQHSLEHTSALPKSPDYLD